MNLQEIRDDLLRKVGIETPGDAPSYVLDDVLTAINQSGQLLNAAGDPFWFLRTEDISHPAGGLVSAFIDGHKVKKVIRASDSRPLMRCESTEHPFFHRIYLGQTDAAADAETGEIIAFSVEVVEDSGESKTRVTVGNRNSGIDGALVYYVPYFEPFVTADLSSTVKSPDVPASYVETVFLPVARFYLSRSHWFSRQDLLPVFERDYSTAVSIMRAVNPEIHVPFSDQVKSGKPKEAAPQQ